MASDFSLRYVDRTDPEYRKVPWYHFVLLPGEHGSPERDFIRTAKDLHSAVEDKILSDTVPHTDADGRELTLEFLKDQVAEIISCNDYEWVRGCDGILALHSPDKREKLVSILANLPLTHHDTGLQKLLSVRHNGQTFALKVGLFENRHVHQNSIVIGLTNPEEPAAVRLVENDGGGSIQFTTFNATKQAMEHFALHSLCVDLCSHLNIPLGAIEYQYEPLGNKFPDFELIVDGQEWAVEVTRIESGMVSYVEVERDLDRRGIDRVLSNRVTDVNVGKALHDALSEKSKRRAKCPDILAAVSFWWISSTRSVIRTPKCGTDAIYPLSRP